MADSTVTHDTTLYTGQVKWFNSRSGYGFITVKNDCPKKDIDIFVHYTNIDTSSQYKYLVQGEYVQFTLLNSVNDSHEVQASNVTGILGGDLMCQVRKSLVKLDDNGPPRKPRSRPPRSKSNDDHEQVVEN
jgi:cold shock CspA family protein